MSVAWPPRITQRAADPRSDFANALRIVRHYGQELLYVSGIGWHVWAPPAGPWREDALAARRIAAGLGKIVAGEAAEEAARAAGESDPDMRQRRQKLADSLFTWSRKSEMAGSIDAALGLASTMLAVKVDQLDADPWLLGCPNCVLELKMGTVRPHRREDFITKLAGADFDPGAQAPIWMATLERIFRGHPELVGFVQRLAGYWLTGVTDPAMLFVAWGAGANGKSTVMGAIRTMLGDYAAAAPPGLLIARHGESHPTELAMLRGLRLVIASESGEGGRLDEERVKLLTGGDTITARRMRQDFIEFPPTHKTALQTNHRPRVLGVDEGIWRRITLTPFTETIPPEERDRELSAKLRAELPGIFAWAARGTADFIRDGLQPPEIVRAATDAYRSDSDALGAFMAEECIVLPSVTCSVADLYAAYAAWCEEVGERPMSKRALGIRLEERGLAPFKGTAGQRRWQGITLRGASGASDRFSGSALREQVF